MGFRQKWFTGALAVLGFLLLSLPEASAETRSLKLIHLHTGEKGEVIFKRNGRYDQAGLKKINYLLRDWRKNQPTTMNPKLLDLVWEAYREAGATGYINVVCGYRSPSTNAMLKSRSRTSGVAEKSQHMLGNAMDFFIPGVKLKRLREIGLKMQGGGVGFYPTSGSPFVHFDVGNVRHWPKMSRKELVALFPNGKTLHVPSDGKPLPGFEQALASYKSRKSAGALAIASATGSGGGARRSLFSSLFGGGADEEEDSSPVAMADAAQARQSFRNSDSAPAAAKAQAVAQTRTARSQVVKTQDDAVKPEKDDAVATPEPKAVLPGIRIVSPQDANPVEVPRETEEATPETLIAALSPRRVPLPVAAPRAEDLPKIEEAVTDTLTELASATPATLSDKAPAELDAAKLAADAPAADEPAIVAFDVPLPTWRPMEETPVVAAAAQAEIPARSEPDAAVLLALADAQNTREKAADLVAPLPSDRPMAPGVAALANVIAPRPPAPLPMQLASAGSALPGAVLVPGFAPADDGAPDSAALLAAAKADARRKQIHLASISAADERLALASAFAGMTPKSRPAQAAASPRKVLTASAVGSIGKGDRTLAATLFSVRTTGKEARPSRRDLKPEARPVVVDAEPAAARWAIYGDAVAARTDGARASSFAYDLVRTAPREVYTAGFRQGEAQADASRFTGKAVTFLTVARFETD